MVLRDGPNQRWRLDFAFNARTDERRFPIPALVDDVSRKNVMLVADTSFSGHRVVRELHRTIAKRGAQKTLVSDNGRAFTSIEIQKWIQDTGIARHHIALKMPQPNGFVKGFNGKPGNWSPHETRFARKLAQTKLWKKGRRSKPGAEHIRHWKTAHTHGIPTEKDDAQNGRLRSEI